MPSSSTWDDNANTNLLLSIIEVLNPKPPNWEEVTAMIATKGYDFTKEACRQHYQKLRKDAKVAPGEVARPIATPRKRRVKSPALSGDADEEPFKTPSKKRKLAAPKPRELETDVDEEKEEEKVAKAKAKIEAVARNMDDF